MEKQELNDKEAHARLQRKDFMWAFLYTITVFCYSGAILLICIQAFQFQPTLGTQYEEIISNWHMDVVNEIEIGGTCGSQSFKSLAMINWVLPDGMNTSFCLKRLTGINFASDYLVTPKCASHGEVICGGIDLSTKFCVPVNQSCPINGLAITNESVNPFSTSIMLSSTYWLHESRLSDNLPILDLRFAYGPGVCRNLTEFVSHKTSAYYKYPITKDNSQQSCGGINPDYTLLQSVSASQFMQANGVPEDSDFTDKEVGLFILRYVPFEIECRESLVDRILESPNYWRLMRQSMPVLLVISSVYFGFVGVLINTLMLIYSSPCPMAEHSHEVTVVIRRGIVVIRVLGFITLSISVIVTYFSSAQLHNTLNKPIEQICTSTEASAIFQSVDQSLDRWRYYIIPIFWIYITALIIETLAVYIIIYHSISNKRRNLRTAIQEDQKGTTLEPYERLHTDPTNRQPPSPKFQQRPSFNPADQMQLRMSIKRMSVHPRGKPTQQAQVIAIQAESREDSPRDNPVSKPRDVSFKPMNQQPPPVFTTSTPSNAGNNQFVIPYSGGSESEFPA